MHSDQDLASNALRHIARTAACEGLEAGARGFRATVQPLQLTCGNVSESSRPRMPSLWRMTEAGRRFLYGSQKLKTAGLRSLEMVLPSWNGFSWVELLDEGTKDFKKTITAREGWAGLGQHQRSVSLEMSSLLTEIFKCRYA